MILNCNATIEKPITSGTVIYFTSSNFSSPISHSTGANSRYLTCRLHIVQGSESLSGLAILSEHQRSTDLIKSKGDRRLMALQVASALRADSYAFARRPPRGFPGKLMKIRAASK